MGAHGASMFGCAVVNGNLLFTGRRTDRAHVTGAVRLHKLGHGVALVDGAVHLGGHLEVDGGALGGRCGLGSGRHGWKEGGMEEGNG